MEMDMYWLRGPFKYEFYAGIFLIFSLAFVLIQLNSKNKWIRRLSFLLPVMTIYWCYVTLFTGTSRLTIALIVLAISLLGCLPIQRLIFRRYLNFFFIPLFAVSIVDSVNTYFMIQSMILVQQAAELGDTHLLDEDKELEKLHYAFIIEYDTLVIDSSSFTGSITPAMRKQSLLKFAPHINGEEVDLCYIDKLLRLRILPVKSYRYLRFRFRYSFFERFVDKYGLYLLERSGYHWRDKKTSDIFPIR